MIHDLIRKYKGPGPLRILDMGCGTGALLSELGQYGEASGVDFSSQAVEYCKQRGINDVIQGRAEALPFANGRFDIVLALDVIEHVEKDEQALKELGRVTKQGGMVIVFVPAFQVLWGITDVVSKHFRRYTKPELKTKVQTAGLKIVRASYFNTFLFLPILLVRSFNRLLPKKYQPEHEAELPGEFMNKVFYSIFSLEAKLFKRINFPFGVSLAVIAEKP